MTAATATTKIYLALLIGMNALISSFCMDAFIRFFQTAVAALVSQLFCIYFSIPLKCFVKFYLFHISSGGLLMLLFFRMPFCFIVIALFMDHNFRSIFMYCYILYFISRFFFRLIST